MSFIRLKIFHEVAKQLNFSKAAERLYISQPAVTKNIQELESELNAKLFERKAGKISLTEAGHLVLKYVEEVLTLERTLHFDLNTMKQQYSGELHLGASTTIGQYILPPILAKFHSKYQEVSLTLMNDNTEKIEQAVLDHSIDMGIVEGMSKNKQLKYIPFMKDEIVAIAHTSQLLSSKDEISLKELKELPIVLREPGSGSLEVITEKLKEQQIGLKDLNIVMHLGSTESIKSYLTQSNTLGLISIHAVSKELLNGTFKVIDIRGFSITRMFYFIHTHGQPSGLSDLFMRFVQTHHN